MHTANQLSSQSRQKLREQPNLCTCCPRNVRSIGHKMNCVQPQRNCLEIKAVARQNNCSIPWQTYSSKLDRPTVAHQKRTPHTDATWCIAGPAAAKESLGGNEHHGVANMDFATERKLIFTLQCTTNCPITWSQLSSQGRRWGWCIGARPIPSAGHRWRRGWYIGARPVPPAGWGWLVEGVCQAKPQCATRTLHPAMIPSTPGCSACTDETGKKILGQRGEAVYGLVQRSRKL